MTHGILNAWKRDTRGAAAIEFSFIASFLVFCLIAVVDMGSLVSERSNMRNAMQAGAYYFMMGGDDADEAEATVKRAWGTLPQETRVAASEYCECGDVSVACTATCTDGSAPDVYHKIDIETCFVGILMENCFGVDETIRIR